MQINNVLNQVRDNRYQKRKSDPIGVMIHRTGVDDRNNIVLGYDAISISNHFRGRDKAYPEVARATGGQLPYSLMIGGDRGKSSEDRDGVIWQTLPLDEIGWHARSASRSYVGVACIGDFRSREPSGRQWASLVHLVGVLCSLYSWAPDEVTVVGHGDVAEAHDGTKAPGRHNACPGDLINLQALRSRVIEILSAWRVEWHSGLIKSLSD